MILHKAEHLTNNCKSENFQMARYSEFFFCTAGLQLDKKGLKMDKQTELLLLFPFLAWGVTQYKEG